jgi:signal transduction histidine kinase
MLERERDNKLMNMQAVTAAMAHELKQPLTAISANGQAVQLVLDRTKPDRNAMQSALDSIVEDSHRASQILNDIRALFLKVDSEHEPIDVNEIASGVVRLLQDELKAHGVVARVELASDLPRVMGHKGQLQEVLVNLLQNAMEAMNAVKAGRRRLWLRTERHGDDAIIVEVKDSGPGINPANLNGIFDAFFTTKSHGTGLGLAICRMIIERHGGQLSASSDGTHGALFLFVLPARMNTHETTS